MQLHTISTSLRNTGYHGDAAEAAGCREKERERRERESLSGGPVPAPSPNNLLITSFRNNLP